MLVSDIGEFALIDRLASVVAESNARCIRRLAERGHKVRIAIGDDAAAWEDAPGVRVATTDTVVEGVHFKLEYTPWRDLGWKSVAVNQSDVAAMGCLPTYAVITLGLRGDLPVSGLEEMYLGMMEAFEANGGAMVGGDIVRSPVFFVTVALEGAQPAGTPCERDVMRRDTARPGDLIAVTGHLGCSGGGLRLLMQGSESRDVSSAHLIAAQNRPQPRVAQGIALASSGVKTAMDVSDGLMDDLAKLCKASGVGAVVQAHKVPVDPRLKSAFPDDWLNLALGGGEDYELLFAASKPVMQAALALPGMDATVIGEIVEGQGVSVVDQNGVELNVSHGGWDHFRT